jgi:Kelch motif
MSEILIWRIFSAGHGTIRQIRTATALLLALGCPGLAQSGPWVARAPLPYAVWGASSAVVREKLYVIGGATGGAGITSGSRVLAYNPNSNTWTPGSDLPPEN